MRLEELKAQLEETQNLIQEKSQEETDMRQRARFCRDQIKLYNNVSVNMRQYKDS